MPEIIIMVLLSGGIFIVFGIVYFLSDAFISAGKTRLLQYLVVPKS